MSLLVPEVVFTGSSITTHLGDGGWTEGSDQNQTICGLRATALGYYQIGLAEVHCLTCVKIYETGEK